jgi:phosphoglycolate phosphatase-like HAD superfamily hydrolase
LKAFRAQDPAKSLKRNGDRHLRGRLLRRSGGRFRHRSAERVAPARPPAWGRASARHIDELPIEPRAFVFDVEGTLVDNVLATLQCWSETLSEIGHPASVADLHPYSGMDGKRMLRRLLNRHDPKLLEHIVDLQGERYRLRYLPHVRPFAGIRQLFTIIKDGGARIALATSCDKDELAHYRAIMNVDDLIDCAYSGDDVRREKPAPDVINLATRRLRVPPGQIAMIGDTPSDAEAAHAAGLASIGVQTGHFSRSDLVDAGCAAVFFDLQALTRKLEEGRAVEPADVKSHIAAMADSH